MAIPKAILACVLIVVSILLLLFSISLIKLSRSVSSYKHYWEETAFRPVSKGSLIYVALGDSTAQGIGASRPEKSYVALNAQKLSDISGQPVHVVNLSESGATLKQLTDHQLPKLKKLNIPETAVITLAIGSNDLVRFEKDKFLAQADELFKQLPPLTIVADIPYFGGGRARNRESSALIASEIISYAAHKYNLRFAPLHQTTKTQDSLKAYSADWLHPSDKGYENWHDAFAGLLKR